MSFLLAWAFALSTAPAPPLETAPEAGASRELILTGQLDRVDGESGGGGRLDYLHLAAGGRGLTIGVASYELLGSRWTYGDVGGLLPLGGRSVLTAAVSLGSGEREREDFGYESYRLGLSVQAVPSELALTLETEYLDIDQTRGNLVTGRIAWIVSRRLSLEVAGSGSTSGNLDSEFALARVDWQMAGHAWMGGFGGGQSRPEIFDIIGSRQSIDTREVFAGVRLPVGASELLFLADYLDLDGTERLTLTLALRLAMGSTS